MAYMRQLSTEFGFKPKLSRENNSFIVRFREVGHPKLALPADSMEVAVAIKMRIEGERATTLFIDYGKGSSASRVSLQRAETESSSCHKPHGADERLSKNTRFHF